MTDNNATQAELDQERRQSLRLDMENELISITVTKLQGLERTKQVVCIDVSNGGIAINNDEAIDINMLVKVRLALHQENSPNRIAKVIRCDIQPSGWFNIGLLFLNKKEQMLESTE